MPYPHVERAIVVVRPALVISSRPLGPDGALLWVLMITNARRPAWPGDVIIPDAVGRGLVIPSKVRASKIATTEVATAELVGRIDEATLAEVLGHIASYFPPFAPPP